MKAACAVMEGENGFDDNVWRSYDSSYWLAHKHHLDETRGLLWDVNSALRKRAIWQSVDFHRLPEQSPIMSAGPVIGKGRQISS